MARAGIRGFFLQDLVAGIRIVSHGQHRVDGGSHAPGSGPPLDFVFVVAEGLELLCEAAEETPQGFRKFRISGRGVDDASRDVRHGTGSRVRGDGGASRR